MSFRSLIVLTTLLLIEKEFYINMWLISRFIYMFSISSFMFQHFSEHLISIQLNDSETDTKTVSVLNHF